MRENFKTAESNLKERRRGGAFPPLIETVSQNAVVAAIIPLQLFFFGAYNF